MSRTQRKAFRYRLAPTRSQLAEFERFANARRFTYNWGLARWREYYEEHGSTIPFAQLLRELTALKRKRQYAWLRRVDSQLLQQALWDLRSAFEAFFDRRARYPTFKARKCDRQRFRIPQRVELRGARVYVPKIGPVKLRLSREPGMPTTSATFSADASGHWYVSLVASFEPPPPVELAPSSPAVGIDLGVTTFATTSDGRLIIRPRRTNRHQRRLRRAHRAVSRRRRGSRNRAKARRALAREYERARASRHDWLHKLTTQLVEQYDFICIEDLGVRGLARTKLARRLHDLALREFRRQITYKAAWRGKTVVAVDRFFPSTKRCPDCGVVRWRLAVSQREWTCASCGARHHRDLAAARNILDEGRRVAAGRADTENACGVRSRLSMGAADAEAGTRRTPGRQHGGALRTRVNSDDPLST